MIVVLGKDNILTKFRENTLHVVHAGKFGKYFRLLSLILCINAVLDEDNMLTDFRENRMHVVHVVRARMCTRAFGLYF